MENGLSDLGRLFISIGSLFSAIVAGELIAKYRFGFSIPSKFILIPFSIAGLCAIGVGLDLTYL